MKTNRHIRLLFRLVLTGLLLCPVVWGAMPARSDDFTDRRITTGAKIFRALLAADVDISRKITTDGDLRICVLYDDDSRNAERAARIFRHREDPRIREMNVRVDVLSLADCLETRLKGYAGVFMTQVLNEQDLALLIDRVNARKILLFSPLEGDVERGVQSGIAVEARVRPYLNVKALLAADIRLKSFFVKVAKAYER